MRKPLLKVLLVSAALSIFFVHAESQAYSDPHEGVSPEDTSYVCLGCHDGTIGSYVGSCTVECTSDDSHPIERVYPPPGKEAKYATIESVLAAGIKLSDNKIGCISCHDIANQNEAFLRISNDNSSLCVACHLK